MSLLHRRAALKDRIPGGRDGRRMLGITLVDKVGNGLWTATQALYFTYVTGLSITEVGLLIAVSAGIGIAGAPIAGRVADRLPITRVLIAAQLLRAAAGLALLTTDHFAVLLAIAAFGSLGDRGANVLTKLYAARIAGSERVRYQAVNRTVGNTGFAIGGLAAAAALRRRHHNRLPVTPDRQRPHLCVRRPPHPALRRAPRPVARRQRIRAQDRRRKARQPLARPYVSPLRGQ